MRTRARSQQEPKTRFASAARRCRPFDWYTCAHTQTYARYIDGGGGGGARKWLRRDVCVDNISACCVCWQQQRDSNSPNISSRIEYYVHFSQHPSHSPDARTHTRTFVRIRALYNEKRTTHTHTPNAFNFTCPTNSPRTRKLCRAHTCDAATTTTCVCAFLYMQASSAHTNTSRMHHCACAFERRARPDTIMQQHTHTQTYRCARV